MPVGVTCKRSGVAPTGIIEDPRLPSLLVIGLVMAAVLAVFAWFLHGYAAFWHKILVNDRFAAVNEIVMSEDVPAGWRLKGVEQLVRRNPHAPFWRKVHAWLYRWYVFRLDRLIREIKISSIIKKDDKLEFIEILGDIRAEWLSRVA
jgi:hypothetical protein